MTSKLHAGFWRGRSVVVTGHMGFKGTWLCALLARLGARTCGFGFDLRMPLLYREMTLLDHESVEGDINDIDALRDLIIRARPQVLIHLAAQPIVLDSYADPIGTFRSNVLGTAAVLEAARSGENLELVVVVTSDKVYKNTDLNRPFVEEDALGGNDPYSSSKAAAELVTASMARSFFNQPGAAKVVTARAGNVIGGGDWAAHRLLPDAARAFGSGETLDVRNPHSVRPWQHVLDSLGGYLTLVEALSGEEHVVHPSWNFGPDAKDARSVSDVLEMFCKAWGAGAAWKLAGAAPSLKEAKSLMIDSSLARNRIGWEPVWSVNEAVRRTADWYHDNAKGIPAQRLVERDLDEFLGSCLDR